MININKLRRLAQAATPGPWKMLLIGDGRQKFAVADSEFLSILTVTDEGGATFGTMYDDADAKFITAANPAAITELLDRLEAAEKERDALRAKIEQMERQEPVGYGVLYTEPATGEEDWDSMRKHRVFAEDHIKDFAQAYADLEETIGAISIVPLYALPGAKGE